MTITEKREKLWRRAKADAELDGYMLPEAFVEKAAGYVDGTISLEELRAFYRAMLPDKTLLDKMSAERQTGYFTAKIADMERILNEGLKKPEYTVFNGMTIENIHGMAITLGYLRSHEEKALSEDV